MRSNTNPGPVEAAASLLSFLFVATYALSGLAGFAWLVWLGEWAVVGWGIALAVFMPRIFLWLTSWVGFRLSLAVRRANLQKRRLKASFLVFIGAAYSYNFLAIWALIVFSVCAGEKSKIPMLLWSYSVAIVPLSYMADQEQALAQAAGEKHDSTLPLVATALVCLGLMISLRSVTHNLVTPAIPLVVLG